MLVGQAMRRGTLSHGFNYLADPKLFMFLIESQQPQLGIYIVVILHTQDRIEGKQ